MAGICWVCLPLAQLVGMTTSDGHGRNFKTAGESERVPCLLIDGTMWQNTTVDVLLHSLDSYSTGLPQTTSGRLRTPSNALVRRCPSRREPP